MKNLDDNSKIYAHIRESIKNAMIAQNITPRDLRMKFQESGFNIQKQSGGGYRSFFYEFNNHKINLPFTVKCAYLLGISLDEVIKKIFTV